MPLQLSGIRFLVLGPLEAWEGERRIHLGGVVNERVLAVLLLEAGRVVPIFRLVQAVWSETPPVTASHQIRKAVAELRRRIPDGSDLINTEPSGYRMTLQEWQLDLSLFTAREESARQALAVGARAEAAEQLDEALTLWRGPVLPDTGSATIDAAAAVLEERRLTATETLFDLRLSRGEAAGIIGELRGVVAAHPYRESVRRQLLLALYRAGRQAEAIDEYANARKLLSDELGIDPGPELSALYESILRKSPELTLSQELDEAAGRRAVPRAEPATEPPCTLPYDLGDFTGRQEEVSRLLEEAAGSPGRFPRIVVIDGMGGSGKTTLAVHVAHRMADQYPDGQLYLDLRGYSLDEEAVSLSTALDTLLRVLGLSGNDIPDDVGGRLALWRVFTSQFRLLLILDNAANRDLVRQLMPPSQDSFVMVTSRSPLVELDGAERLSLGMLPEKDSIELLSRSIGATRAGAEADATAELARLCGYLPLALRIASARLRKRRHWTVRYLVERLRNDGHRLDELHSGDLSVAAALTMSYESMQPQLRSGFQLLSLHPGPDFDVVSAAALLGTDLTGAEETLEYLLDAHLLQQYDQGRYSFHNLVRAFAQTLPRHPAEQEVVKRLVRQYFAFVERACDTLYPGRVDYGEAHPSGAGVVLPDLTTPERALAWFDNEQPRITGIIDLAFRHGLHRQATRIGRSLCFYLHDQSYFEQFEAVAGTAVEAARAGGDPELLCVSLTNLAVAYWQRDQYQDGVASLEEALKTAAGLNDSRAEGACLSRLSVFHTSLGNFGSALRYLTQAVRTHNETGSLREEAEALANLCHVTESLGRYTESVNAGRRAVALARETGARGVETTGLANLSLAHLGQGDPAAARDCLTRAHALCEEMRVPARTSLVLTNLARFHLDAGDLADASDHAARALLLARDIGSVSRQATVLNVLGSIDLAAGNSSSALTRFRAALNLAESIGLRLEAARALDGLARGTQALHLRRAAVRLRNAAREYLARLDLPSDYFSFRGPEGSLQSQGDGSLLGTGSGATGVQGA
ncbi:BTAD domain-containing putative transcriptional regulator [Streptomyces sp. TS71-3]|uniref:AfsR/SARP family transcriptional regulator n=1 Tax=Streptomyces sp. TS71-3 TaxID=2733862 RepID=UPI001B2754DA|nr:BTAD domain-containing putative transcriptional regulator [Streptomyces sp. TS71-3]GHJ37053.1 SARP family transcriptional regulator [Streptomyces sp. TS71-3]